MRTTLLTVDQAADQLNVSPRYIYDMVYDRHLDAVKIGRLVRIPASSVEKVIRDGTISATAPPDRFTPGAQ